MNKFWILASLCMHNSGIWKQYLLHKFENPELSFSKWTKLPSTFKRSVLLTYSRMMFLIYTDAECMYVYMHIKHLMILTVPDRYRLRP